MLKRKKIYFYADESISRATGKPSLVFSGENGMRGHRAGGSEDGINFVLEKLIEKNGKNKGIEIYTKFNEALLAIAKEDKSKLRDFPKASLVFMEMINDSEVPNRTGFNPQVDGSVYSGEQRLDKDAKGKKERITST